MRSTWSAAEEHVERRATTQRQREVQLQELKDRATGQDDAR
jgi:hypothetical protein